MIEPNIIIGVLIIVINSLPLILKKPRYLLLTSLLSLVMILGYMFFSGF